MKKRRKHTPEQIVMKLRDADVMLNSGKDVAAVLQSLEICEATYQRWRTQLSTLNSNNCVQRLALILVTSNSELLDYSQARGRPGIRPACTFACFW